MNQIKDIIRHSEHTAEVVIESESIATSARAGHFVIIRFDEECPRIPFTIVDTDPENGTFTIIIHKGARLSKLINCQSLPKRPLVCAATLKSMLMKSSFRKTRTRP